VSALARRRSDLRRAPRRARGTGGGARGAARGSDRVRALFTKAWAQLAPIFAELEGGESGWRFLAFVASGDSLAALDAAGPGFGVEISSDGLRRLARMLAPGAAGDPLAWTGRGPELRESFGFGRSCRRCRPGRGSRLRTRARGRTERDRVSHDGGRRRVPTERCRGPASRSAGARGVARACSRSNRITAEPGPTSWLERIGAALAALVSPARVRISMGDTRRRHLAAVGACPAAPISTATCPGRRAPARGVVAGLCAGRLGDKHRDLFRHLGSR
jgi:hypothetical protein